MHYKCGTEAKVGDYCRIKMGRYLDGQWQADATVEARVLAIDPGPTTCNATVAYLSVEFIAACKDPQFAALKVNTTLTTLGESEFVGRGN
jgi:hypothetical protein